MATGMPDKEFWASPKTFCCHAPMLCRCSKSSRTRKNASESAVKMMSEAKESRRSRRGNNRWEESRTGGKGAEKKD